MSQPPDRSDPSSVFDPFGIWKQSQETWKQSQDTMLESWSKSMIDAVNTSDYADSTGRMLDSYLTVSAPLRKIMEQTMTQVLHQLSLPSRAEVVSLAERMTNIEMRLDDLDARLDVIQRGMEHTASAVAALSTTITSNVTSMNTSEDTNKNAAAQNGASAKKSATASRRTTKPSTATTAQTTQTARTTRGATARSRSKTE